MSNGRSEVCRDVSLTLSNRVISSMGTGKRQKADRQGLKLLLGCVKLRETSFKMGPVSKKLQPPPNIAPDNAQDQTSFLVT